MDLNLFVTLDALLRERNVTRAGKKLGSSQPAASAALARLRELFGDPLLVRVGREYRLTPAAKELAVPLRTALALLERTLDRGARFDPASAEREFRIAASDYTLYILMQPLIERLSKIAPKVRLHLRLADMQVPRRLASNEIDLSIQPAGVLPKLPSTHLYTDSWVCAVWRGNQAVGDRLTTEQWTALPHASFGLGRGGVFLGDAMLGSLAGTRHRTVISESFLALPLLLRGTELIAVVPRRLGERLVQAGDLRLVQAPRPLPELAQVMSWSPLHTDDPAHSWLRRVVAEVASTL